MSWLLFEPTRSFDTPGKGTNRETAMEHNALRRVLYNAVSFTHIEQKQKERASALRYSSIGNDLPTV
ncbi:MAG: hypothetical protein GY811_24985 [Myxococcales bacterium]|nr:hypothetical protein [Myxococcales bacterium]